jgi:hypothetical protein
MTTNEQVQCKCPISGLDATSSKNGFTTYYQIDSLALPNGAPFVFSMSSIYHNGDSPFDFLNASQKGKMFRWLYFQLQSRYTTNDYQYFILPPLYEHDFSHFKQVKESYGLDSDEEKIKKESVRIVNEKITPTQKLEWLLEYIYKGEETVGLSKEISNQELFPYLATVEVKEVGYFLKICAEKKWIEPKKSRIGTHPKEQWQTDESFFDSEVKKEIILTLEGFEAYDVLMKGKAHSDFGFLALEFDDSNTFYSKLKRFLKKEMSIDLKDQKKQNRTGNVNVSMEANIRKCRFMIADITPSMKIKDNNLIPNANVMWEAGFAEGLNKPVLYICKQIIKDAPFDVRNHYCIEYGETVKSHHNACQRIKEALENTFAQRGE